MKFYIHYNGAAVYVKEGKFFESQKRQEPAWDTSAWIPVFSQSVEGARKIGEQMVEEGSLTSQGARANVSKVSAPIIKPQFAKMRNLYPTPDDLLWVEQSEILAAHLKSAIESNTKFAQSEYGKVARFHLERLLFSVNDFKGEQLGLPNQ